MRPVQGMAREERQAEEPAQPEPEPAADVMDVLRHWVVTSPSEPVSRLAVLTEANAKVYTDHGWTRRGPFVLEAQQPQGAVQEIERLRSVLGHVINRVVTTGDTQELRRGIFETGKAALDYEWGQ